MKILIAKPNKAGEPSGPARDIAEADIVICGERIVKVRR